MTRSLRLWKETLSIIIRTSNWNVNEILKFESSDGNLSRTIIVPPDCWFIVLKEKLEKSAKRDPA